MRLGISVNSAYAVEDPREGARWMVERARAASAAALDSLFVGDHHATPIPYYQNTAILGRMLAEWTGPTTGALYLLPLWHPVIVAEQVATLASLAPARFVLQCAIGPDDVQFPALGIDPRQRPSRFEQSLDILRRLWAGESVTCEGRFSLRDARASPTPPEPIRVWIGAAAPPAIERAARLGDGWLAAPALTPDVARRQLDFYRESCAARARPHGEAVIRRDVYVGASAAEARDTAAAILAGGYRGFSPDAPIVGEVGAVAEAFHALGEMGYDEVLVRNLVPVQDRALACIERLADVRQALAH